MTLQTLVIIFAALMALDVVQTYFFPRFGLKEGNPILAKLMAQYGFDALFLAKYVVFVGVVVAAGEGLLPLWALVAFVAGYCGLVAWNLRSFYQVLQRTKK